MTLTRKQSILTHLFKTVLQFFTSCLCYFTVIYCSFIHSKSFESVHTAPHFIYRKLLWKEKFTFLFGKINLLTRGLIDITLSKFVLSTGLFDKIISLKCVEIFIHANTCPFFLETLSWLLVKHKLFFLVHGFRDLGWTSFVSLLITYAHHMYPFYPQVLCFFMVVNHRLFWFVNILRKCEILFLIR